jgi:transglutaminase-like putative cysteine protease
MKNRRTICLILAVFLATLPFANLPVVRGEAGAVSYFLRSTVRYSNTSQNRTWNFDEREEDRTIGLFMNNTWQTVEAVNSTFSVEKLDNDDDGNPVAVLRFPKQVLSSGENVTFTVWYHITSKPRAVPSISENEARNLSDIPVNLINEYTREEGSWQTSNPTLRELALSLRGANAKVLTVVMNLVRWMKQNISYPKVTHENPYYPNQTYVLREGDCDDQAILLITLCRIIGIPAYLQIGSIYMPNNFDNATMWDGHASIVERQIGWHGWAFVYIPPWGWLPVDLTYVRNNPSDPLSSIKYGAVTQQDTIQYMNVTHTDYVALSLESKAFLLDNGFNVYEEDEMTLDIGQGGSPLIKPVIFNADLWVSLALIVFAAFFVVTSFLIFRRFRRRRVEEVAVPPESIGTPVQLHQGLD